MPGNVVTLHVQCPGCGQFALAGPENHANPDSVLDGICVCCPQDHDHAAAASACPGGHAGQPCPYGPGENACPVFAGGTVVPSGNPGDFAGPMNKGTCPGGHCGKGVPGCTVCRPLTITGLRGLIGTLQPATAIGG